MVWLTGFADGYPRQLSRGKAERAALARALVNDPPLTLNEPLGRSDSLIRITMQCEVVGLRHRAGFTALLVAPDVEEGSFLAHCVIVPSNRPAIIRADIPIELPCPWHRGDPCLAELCREILGPLGLDAAC